MSAFQKKILTAGLFFFVALFIAGCEQTLTSTDFPYEEVLVIRGELIAGDTLNALYVGRTLPYEENTYSYWDPATGKYVEPESEGWVKDATVFVSTDDKVFVMTYTQRGLYKNDLLLIEAGKTYQLHVEWKGKKADAVTTVPETPVLDSVTISSTVEEYHEYNYGSGIETHTHIRYTYQGYCRSKKNEVLVLNCSIESKYSVSSPEPTVFTTIDGSDMSVFQRLQTDDSLADVLQGEFRTYFYSSWRMSDLTRKSIFTLTSYDAAFYRYYDTYYMGGNDFSVEPRPVAWNVKGDAIGMFIGASESVVKAYQIQ